MAAVLTPTRVSTLNHLNSIILNHRRHHQHNEDEDHPSSTHSTPQRKPRTSFLKKSGQHQTRTAHGTAQLDPTQEPQPRRRVVFSRSRSLSECSPTWSKALVPGSRDSSEENMTRGESCVGRLGSQSQLCRMRSFKSTSKGLVRNGECFKPTDTRKFMSTGSVRVYRQLGVMGRSESIESTDSSVGGSSVAESYYRVGVLGASRVGKSALIKKFLASEELQAGFSNTSDSDVCIPVTVSVLLDGKESLLEFWDPSQLVSEDAAERQQEVEEERRHGPSTSPSTDSHATSATTTTTTATKAPTTEGRQDDNNDMFDDHDLCLLQTDAYTIVFALNDPASFRMAGDILRHLREELGSDRAITLVGNKSDLARQRRVTDKDACSLAHQYDCKYIETSAELGHHTDELLVGTLRQIQLKLSTSQDDETNDVRPLVRRHPKWQKLTLLYRFLNGASQSVDSCQNFFV